MLTWHAPHAWLGGPDLTSDVLIDTSDGVITGIRTGHESDADTVFDGVVLPGLVSAHSHAFHRRLRGRTYGSDFWAWRSPMYAVANSLAPASYRDLARAVFGEMLTAGITTVGEFHYVHHQPDGSPYDEPNAFGFALVDAASDVGIRMTVIDTAYLTSDVTGEPVLDEQRRFSDGSIDRWQERVRALEGALAGNDMVRLGVAAHSVRGVAAQDLATVAETAADLKVPLHVHAAEQTAEIDATSAEHGITPVRLLAETGVLGPQTTIVHGTHLTEDDIGLLASSGSIVCFCPTTEANLGDGIGPALELADAGVPLCLGSDSNAVIDILHEANRLEQHDRLRLRRRGIHEPAALLLAATGVGMRSLGWPDGGLTVGMPADFIAIDMASRELVDTETSLGAIVAAATRASVERAVVAGVTRVGG